MPSVTKIDVDTSQKLPYKTIGFGIRGNAAGIPGAVPARLPRTTGP